MTGDDVSAVQEGLRVALRARELSDVLFEIGRHMNLARSPSEVAGLTLGLACDVLGARWAAIDRRELGGWVTSHLYGSSLAQVGVYHSDGESPVLAEMKRTGKPVVVSDSEGTGRLGQLETARSGCEFHMSFPLTLRNRVVGGLTFCFGSAGLPPGEEEMEFGVRLAIMLSTAEENSLTLSRHQSIAEAFQRALIDVPRTLPSVDVGHLYAPATDGDIAGGDFYDVFPLDSGRVAATIGDVSGRGLGAATLTALVRDSIRTTALDGLSPGDILQKTNRVLLAFSPPEAFVTVFFCVIDPQTGETVYSGGGNPAPFLVDQDHRVTPLADSGPLLGVLEDVQFPTQQLMLRPGDRLVLYTDGLSKVRREGTALDSEGIIRVLRDSESHDSHGLALELHDRAVEFSGGAFKDDVAILVVGLKG